MFGKKNESELLRMFREVNEESSKSEKDEMTIKENIVSFIKYFPRQSVQYKIVWTIRILRWILLLGISGFGLILRVKNIFL